MILRILGEFWEDSGRILVGFWEDSGFGGDSEVILRILGGF